jgi:hypothetical protein
MSFLPAVMAIASGAISAVGAISSANAQAAAADYNAKVDQRNRLLEDQNRRQALITADIDAQDKRKEQARTMGQIRAAYGASGLEMAGSPLDVLEDSAIESSLDVQRTEYEGRAAARSSAIKMQGYSEDAVLQKMNAKASKTAGMISAFGYLAGGVGQALKVNAA